VYIELWYFREEARSEHMKLGAYKDINEELSRYLKREGRGNEPIFHIIAGTSIGAINAAILVSNAKENRTWEGSGEGLSSFGNISPHDHGLIIYHISLTIGILGVY
jgi:hypothetical protein